MMRRFLFPVLAYVGARLSARAFEQWLAAKPARYSESQLRQEPQGEVSYIERPDGTRLRAISAGQGPCVVLAHGFCVSLIEWNIVWEALRAAGLRVICFDQRGHEQSTVGKDGISTRAMAEDYLAVLEHFAVRDGVLVGHSMGGFLAIAAVLEVPEVAARLSGLVLCATFAGIVSQGAPQNRLQLPLLEHGILQQLIAQRTLSLLFGRSMYGDHPVLAEIELFLEVFRRQNHRQLLPILRAFNDENRYGRLGEIKLPTVVICGQKDRTTPPWHSSRIAQEIAGAELIWVEGVGHCINWEAPQPLIDAITRLAKR